MKNILLIEDSPDIRETTAEILELAGYKVFTAANGKLGVEQALAQKVDLVVCDIMMPVLDGFGVLHIFNQTAGLQNIPFVFLTAKTDRADQRKGMEMGADDYITKPFEEIELLNAIESRLKKLESLSRNLANTHADVEQFYQNASQHSELQSLSNDRKVLQIRRKQIIYQEGDEAQKFYFLKNGKIKTYQTNRDGKEFITALYNTGDFFGHLAIIENTEHSDTAEALENSEIVAIPKHDFLQLLTRNQTVANQFIKLLANNIQEKEKQLIQMAYNSLRKRTADALLLLASKYRKDGDSNFAMKISRDDLAAVVGTATESLIRMLSEFKADRYIEISGSEIRILDQKKLENLRA
jgi:CRP-like cAMP-binding protein